MAAKNHGLKKLFMVIGNRLVQEQGFEPAMPSREMLELAEYRGTDMLALITTYFNQHEEARQLLFELTGEDWPMA